MRSLLKSKKGQIGTLQTLITTLVVIGILIGVGFLVLEEFYNKMTAGTQAALGVNETIYALKVIPTWLSIIIIVAVAGIILAIVFSALPRAPGV